MSRRSRRRARWTVILAAAAISACAPTFRSNITPIKAPESYQTSHRQDGLQLGFHFLSAEE